MNTLGWDGPEEAAWIQQQREEQRAQQLSRSSSRAASLPVLPPSPKRGLLGPAGEAKRAWLTTSALDSREAALGAGLVGAVGLSTSGALHQPQAWQRGVGHAEVTAPGEPLSAQLRQQLGAALAAASDAQQGQGEARMGGHALLADGGTTGGWLMMGIPESGEAAAVGGSPMLAALVEGK